MKSFKLILNELVGNIGVSRKAMPQIKSTLVGDFLDELKAKGIKVTSKKIAADDLTATQKEIDNDKVLGMTKNAPEKSLNKPIIVSKDMYVLDGHHRWIALRTRNPNFKMTAWVVDLPIRALIQAANQFSKVKHKNLSDSYQFPSFMELLEKATIIGKVDLNNLRSTQKDEHEVSKKDLDQLEKTLDALFHKVGIDIEFTRHFLDRVNDDRNGKAITIKELRELFTDTFKKYAKELSNLGDDAQAVLVDIQSKVNVPFVLKWDTKSKMLDLVSKTVMRKANFKTSNKKYSV